MKSFFILGLILCSSLTFAEDSTGVLGGLLQDQDGRFADLPAAAKAEMDKRFGDLKMTPAEGVNRDQGARAGMCVKDEPSDLEKGVAFKELLQQECQSQGGSCGGANCNNLRYAFGGSGTQVQGSVANPHQATDCSSMVSGSLKTAGFLLEPGKENVRATTATFAEYAKKAAAGDDSTCFDIAELSRDLQILPGDVINCGGQGKVGHVVKVSLVGKDPFDCAGSGGANPANWQATITHSCQGGIQKAHLSKAGGKILPGLLKMAQLACGGGGKAGPDITSSGKGAGMSCSILRHKGKLSEKCHKEPPSIKGEQCTQGCYKLNDVIDA